jgi:hypothetical protein
METNQLEHLVFERSPMRFRQYVEDKVTNNPDRRPSSPIRWLKMKPFSGPEDPE